MKTSIIKVAGIWIVTGLLAWGQEPERFPVLGGDGFAVEMVLIEPGEFTQGSPDQEEGRKDDELARKVTLTRPFLLGKYPVTVGEFRQFTKETGYKTEAEKGTSGGYGWDGKALVQKREYTWKNPGFPQTDRHPVTLVTWQDAKEFCKWLGRKTGRTISLPSEAQWEYACRAGSENPFSEGVDPKTIATVETALGGTKPVNEGPINAWGLVDLPGNAWEWCEDWFGPYEPGPVTDPVQKNQNLSDKPRRVLRGGSFLKGLSNARSAARFRNDAQSRNADNGFRIMTFDLAAKPVPAKAPVAKAVTPVEVENLGPRPTAPSSSKSQPLVTPRAPTSTTPPRQSSSPRQSSGGIGILFAILPCALVIAIVIGGIILLTKLLGRGRSPVTRPDSTMMSLLPVSVEVTEDGFWVKASVSNGTLMRWRCRLGDQWETRDFSYLGGPRGQFIATGMRPSEVSVLRVSDEADEPDHHQEDDTTPPFIPVPIDGPTPSYRSSHRPSAY